jgi:hypothetical protein
MIKVLKILLQHYVSRPKTLWQKRFRCTVKLFSAFYSTFTAAAFKGRGTFD